MDETAQISDARQPVSSMAAYLLAAFAVGQALYVNDGNYDIVGLIWISIAALSLMVGISGSRDRWLAKVPASKLAAVLLGVQWAQLLTWGIGFRRSPGGSTALFIAGMLIAGAGVIFCFRSKRGFIALSLLIAGHTLAGADVLRHTKDVFIDAHYFQQESTAALLHGQNPYDVRYRNIYAPATNYYGADVVDGDHLRVSHPYPPLTLLLAAPARLVGDVRWAHLISIELAAVLIALTARSPHTFWAAAMMLLNPRALMVVYFGWTESMVLLCMVFVLFCAVRAPKLLWLALGLLLAVKQYTVLLMPLALLLMPARLDWRGRVRTMAKAVALAAVITVPFILWHPSSFLRSVVLMQMRQPFRVDALSFPALLWHVTRVQAPSIVAFFLAGASLIWCWRRAGRSSSAFAASSGLVLLVFFAFNKQAFCNYYFLTAGICCCAVGVVPLKNTLSIAQSDEPRTRRLAA